MCYSIQKSFYYPTLRILVHNIQALLAAQGGARAEREAVGPNMGSHIEVAKPAIFNREAEKVGGFITACRLFLRIKLRKATVEEQVQ